MFWFFKGCCGTCDPTDERPYEIPRRDDHFSPVEPTVLQTLRNDGLTVSVCPAPKALCDGRVLSLLDHSSFDPPLSSTKLTEETRRSQSDSELVKSPEGTLSDSFWNDIKRWDEKQKPKRRQTFGGVGYKHSHSSSSDFSTAFDIPSYNEKLPLIMEEKPIRIDSQAVPINKSEDSLSSI